MKRSTCLSLNSSFCCLAATLLGAMIGCQNKTSPDKPPAGLPALTSPESLPEWARTGRYRSARWDGGSIEAEKGRLSGWGNYTPEDPLGIMAATRDWHNPRTVEFLKTAGVNWAWVTWSVGFSHETEEAQRRELRPYINECRKNGIRVAAYISIANMFWRDMFANVPVSKTWVDVVPDGSPRFYSFPNRYMARISHPEWLDYAKDRVRAAMEAGVDSFWIDNTFSYHGAEDTQRFLSEAYKEAGRFGRKVVIMSNYNRGTYTWARFQNGVTTEDAEEPGFYPEDTPEKRLVTNVGLLRYQYGISEGWRPVSVEYGGRHRGDRFTTPMESHKWQLSLAEAAAFQASLEPFFEGMFLRDLYRGELQAIEKPKAIGRYNAFFEQHSEYYVEPQSAAKIAVFSDTTDRIVPLLNQLAEYNVEFDVLFNYQKVTLERLNTYRVVLLPHTNPIPTRLSSHLTQFVRDGGVLIAIEDASLFGLGGNASLDFGLAEPLGVSVRRHAETRTVTQLGKGRGIYYPVSPVPTQLAEELKELARPVESVRVTVKRPVLYNVVHQRKFFRIVIHLLNYSQRRLGGTTVRVGGRVGAVKILSPDSAVEKSVAVTYDGSDSCFDVSELLTYSLVVIQVI